VRAALLLLLIDHDIFGGYVRNWASFTNVQQNAAARALIGKSSSRNNLSCDEMRNLMMSCSDSGMDVDNNNRVRFTVLWHLSLVDILSESS
jgi:hypothetical protein